MFINLKKNKNFSKRPCLASCGCRLKGNDAGKYVLSSLNGLLIAFVLKINVGIRYQLQCLSLCFYMCNKYLNLNQYKAFQVLMGKEKRQNT